MIAPSPDFEPHIILAAAATPPGPDLSVALAKAGARIVALDPSASDLAAIAKGDPERIETLTLDSGRTSDLRALSEGWASERIDLVINLMPLVTPQDITLQLRQLTVLTRHTARGLIRGQGAVVSLVGRPADPLALMGHGSCAALNAGGAALNRALNPRGVQFYTLTVPPDAPYLAQDLLVQMATRGRLGLRGGRIDLG